MHNVRLSLARSGVVALAALVASGCSSSVSTPARPAELRLVLTDAPAAYDQVWVSLVGVDVHRVDVVGDETGPTACTGSSAMMTEDGGLSDAGQPCTEDGGVTGGGDGWVRIVTARQKIELLGLTNGVTLDLGGSLLPAGDYDMIRLIIDDAWVVVAGSTFPLTVPSGMQSGIKIHYALTLASDVSTTLTLDFDAAASVMRTGNGKYMMRPVLRVVDRQDRGHGSHDMGSVMSDCAVSADDEAGSDLSTVDDNPPSAGTGASAGHGHGHGPGHKKDAGPPHHG